MDIKYQINLRKERLSHLFVAWEQTLIGVPAAEDLPAWGLSGDEVIEYRAIRVHGGGIEEGGYEYDVEFETEVDGLLVEHLDSLRIAENYREMQNTNGSILDT